MAPSDPALLAVLRAHALRYPLSEPRDAVKLLYQNEFGGGHLIRDEGACRARLARELGETPQDPLIPPCEEIGGGLVRLMLAAPRVRALGAEEIADLFIASAARPRWSAESFGEKLALLEERLGETGYAFPADALAAFLAGYRAAGCPMLSHSEVYRRAYRPA